MPFSVLGAEPSHWPEIRRIYAEGIAGGDATFETELPEQDAWERGHLPSPRLVAVADGRVRGWAALSPISDRRVYRGVAEVSVYVEEASRRRGIARALLRRLVEASEEEGIWTLQASIFPENRGSLALHRKEGFREVGTRERLGQLRGLWRDVVLMERRSRRVGVPEEAGKADGESTSFWNTRRAGAEDVDGLLEVRNAIWAEARWSFRTRPETREECRRWLLRRGERHPVLILEHDGEIAGWGQILPFGDQSWHAGLGECSIYLDRRARGRGLGAMLLGAVVREAQELGYWKLIALIFSDNAPSRRLFVRAGFREVGVFERHGRLHGAWVDVVAHELCLPDPSDPEPPNDLPP